MLYEHFEHLLPVINKVLNIYVCLYQFSPKNSGQNKNTADHKVGGITTVLSASAPKTFLPSAQPPILRGFFRGIPIRCCYGCVPLLSEKYLGPSACKWILLPLRLYQPDCDRKRSPYSTRRTRKISAMTPILFQCWNCP